MKVNILPGIGVLCVSVDNSSAFVVLSPSSLRSLKGPGWFLPNAVRSFLSYEAPD